jgi:hypothetical protein
MHKGADDFQREQAHISASLTPPDHSQHRDPLVRKIFHPFGLSMKVDKVPRYQL